MAKEISLNEHLAKIRVLAGKAILDKKGKQYFKELRKKRTNYPKKYKK